MKFENYKIICNLCGQEAFVDAREDYDSINDEVFSIILYEIYCPNKECINDLERIDALTLPD